MQSAFKSNNQAIMEKVAIMDRESQDLHQQIRELKSQNHMKDADLDRMQEELNMYKGRCANL